MVCCHICTKVIPPGVPSNTPRVVYWVKYTGLEVWVLVIHYYTKTDPTIEVSFWLPICWIVTSQIYGNSMPWLDYSTKTRLNCLSCTYFKQLTKTLSSPFLPQRVKLANLLQFPIFISLNRYHLVCFVEYIGSCSLHSPSRIIMDYKVCDMLFEHFYARHKEE